MTLAALAILITGHGQTTTGNTSGKVMYEEKLKLEIKLEGESAAFAESLPKERSTKKVLYFSPESSIYLNDKDKETNEAIEQAEASGMHIQIYQNEDRIFCDLKNKKKIEQREFMTRVFLIESELGDTTWKLTGKQKTILNYPCQEAVKTNKDKKVSAWFTPAIPVSTGPDKFESLPGLVLSVDINDGEHTVNATSVEFAAIDKSILVKPKEGKKVTMEQYRKIVDDKMKEMGAEGSGGQHVVIKIQR